MQIYYLMLYFFVYGFLGWCTEVAYATTKQRKFVNYISWEMTPTSIGGEKQAGISGGSQSPS